MAKIGSLFTGVRPASIFIAIGHETGHVYSGAAAGAGAALPVQDEPHI